MHNDNQKEMDEYERTYELVKMLSIMSVRPRLYFKEGLYYEQLMAFLQGFAFCTHLYEGGEMYSWSNLESDVWDEIKLNYGLEEFEDYDDDLKFLVFIEVVIDIFRKKYPEW